MARQEQTYIQKLTVKFLRAANQHARGNMRNLGGILLGGDPGIGKTTFLELFSDLTGIHLITIEVPHIVEEHIINIPFIVYMDGKKKAGSSQLKDKNTKNNDEYDMVLADSNLFTQIKSAQSVPDQQYIASMTDPHPNSNRQRIAQQLFQGLGGTENKIPPMIAAPMRIRAAIFTKRFIMNLRFSSVLFSRLPVSKTEIIRFRSFSL